MPKKKNKLDLTITPEMEAYADEVREQLDKLKNEKIQMKVERTAEKGKTHLSLRNKRLNEVPEAISEIPDCEWIDLSFNKLKEVPDTLWPEHGQLPPHKCTNLKKLDLSRNQLDLLNDGVCNFRSLEELYIQSNQIATIPPKIGDLKMLKFFDFSGNMITALPPSLQDLHLVTDMRMSNNELLMIPEPAEWAMLKHFDARSNILGMFPPVTNWMMCTYLNLACNEIPEIPPCIENMQSLVELNLNNNRITTLPPEIAKLSKLEFLYLGNNNLLQKRGDVEPLLLIAQLTELKELFLFKNQFTSIPKEFDALNKLVKFSCSNNALRKIDPRMAVWNDLEELYLSHNELTEVPASFGAFRKLKEFQIGANPDLETLPESMAFNRQLSQVDCKDCAGTFSLPKAFQALPHCRWIGVKMGKDKKKKK